MDCCATRANELWGDNALLIRETVCQTAFRTDLKEALLVGCMARRACRCKTNNLRRETAVAESVLIRTAPEMLEGVLSLEVHQIILSIAGGTF